MVSTKQSDNSQQSAAVVQR